MSSNAVKQTIRFVRIFLFAFITQWATIGGQHLDRSTIISCAVAALEVVYRALVPSDQKNVQ